MIAVERTVLIVLAAGRSTRFGDAKKLEQDLFGKPVGLHVVIALEDLPFLERIAVIDDCTLDFGGYGFSVMRNDSASTGMAGSLRIGVAHARDTGAEAVVVALADMPRVTAAHVRRLFDVAESSDAVVVSSNGSQPMPPAVFGRTHFDHLLSLTGDMGARELIRTGKQVVTDPSVLIDIDTRADLDRLYLTPVPE